MSSVLLFGATGYLGTPLTLAISKETPKYDLTVYTRNENLDSYFTATIGATRVVHGTHSELEKIQSLSKEYDIVINCATSTDVDFVSAIIDGLKQRSETKKGTLIHLSGTGNFITGGNYDGKASDDTKIWNDANEDDIKLIGPEMPNGKTDYAVLEAGKAGKIMTYIVCPGVVYGAGPTKNLGAGYGPIIDSMRQLGYVPLIGEGSNILETVHIQDVAAFTAKILKIATNEQPAGSVYSRYYMLSSGRVTWKDLAKEFARVLHKKKIINDAEPKKVNFEGPTGFAMVLAAVNMMVQGDRAKQIGFQPVGKPVTETMEEDLAELQ